VQNVWYKGARWFWKLDALVAAQPDGQSQSQGPLQTNDVACAALPRIMMMLWHYNGISPARGMGSCLPNKGLETTIGPNNLPPT